VFCTVVVDFVGVSDVHIVPSLLQTIPVGSVLSNGSLPV
jgi:hypothetical protein